MLAIATCCGAACAVLCCAVLCCDVLCSAVLCCAVLSHSDFSARISKFFFSLTLIVGITLHKLVRLL